MSTLPLPSWAPVASAARRGAAHADAPVAAAFGRCGSLFHRSVLVVDPAGPAGREALRLARSEGARVTALCRDGETAEALESGAEFVLEREHTDPTWYRGAWGVIVDPAGEIGYRRARRSLGPGGAYVTSSARLLDRALAALGRVGGDTRLVRLRG